MIPDTTPIKIESKGLDASHPAVIPTSPAKRPFAIAVRLSLDSDKYEIPNTVKPPVTQDSVVLTEAICITSEFSPVAPKAEPALNPYQPNQRIKVPKVTRPELCGLKISWSTISSNLPILGPSEIAPTSPHTPPTKCTTPDPAKSV